MPLLNEASNVYLGTQPVGAVYRGDVKVWPSKIDYSGLISAQAGNEISLGSDGKLWTGVRPTAWVMSTIEIYGGAYNGEDRNIHKAFSVWLSTSDYELQATATVASDKSWIRVDTPILTVKRAASNIDITLLTKDLPVGTYVGNITVSSFGLPDLVKEVTLEIAKPQGTNRFNISSLAGSTVFADPVTEVVGSSRWEGTDLVFTLPATGSVEAFEFSYFWLPADAALPWPRPENYKYYDGFWTAWDIEITGVPADSAHTVYAAIGWRRNDGVQFPDAWVLMDDSKFAFNHVDLSGDRNPLQQLQPRFISRNYSGLSIENYGTGSWQFMFLFSSTVPFPGAEVRYRTASTWWEYGFPTVAAVEEPPRPTGTVDAFQYASLARRMPPPSIIADTAAKTGTSMQDIRDRITEQYLRNEE